MIVRVDTPPVRLEVSLARAPTVTLAEFRVLTSRVVWNGAWLSVARTTPLTRKSMPITPTLSVAVALASTVDDTTALCAGLVSVATGSSVSKKIAVTLLDAVTVTWQVRPKVVVHPENPWKVNPSRSGAATRSTSGGNVVHGGWLAGSHSCVSA
jgi:hypothetical protein